MKKIWVLLLLFFPLFGEYRFEGYFNNDGEDRFFLMSFFVPYNPHIVTYPQTSNHVEKCGKWWPFGTLFETFEPSCHFLWLDAEDPLSIFQNEWGNFQKVQLIYTKTEAKSYPHMKLFLENSGFKQLCHWYHEGENGDAIFLHRSIFDATMRTLNYLPNALQHSSPVTTSLTPFLKPALHKGTNHSLEGIDFIYMINLDERPEKWSDSLFELEPFGIFPYRFSAVNGWKLPLSTLQEIGVKFPTGSLQEPFMGTTYFSIDQHEIKNHELLKEDGSPYFSFGMSRGAIGICLSHLSVLQDAFDAGYSTIWVMEDDVEVISNPMVLPSLLKRLDQLMPDWDIFFTDGDTKDRVGNTVPCRALAARPNLKIEPLDNFLSRFYPISYEFNRIGMRYGAYSMILRRSGIEKILRHFKTYGIYLPYDMDYWLENDLKMVTVTQPIISHRRHAPTDNNKPHYD